MNTFKMINLPSAVTAILLRKFIDTYCGKTKLIKAVIATNKKSLQPSFLFNFNNNIVYFYLFGAAVTYLVTYVKNTKFASILVRKCSSTALSLKNNIISRRKWWIKNNKSWVLKNLIDNGSQRQKTLAYFRNVDNLRRPDFATHHHQHRTCLKLANSAPNSNTDAFDLSHRLCNRSTSVPLGHFPDNKRPLYKDDEDNTLNRRNYQRQTLSDNTILNRPPLQGYKDYNEKHKEDRHKEDNASSIDSLNVYTPSVLREIVPSTIGLNVKGFKFKRPKVPQMTKRFGNGKKVSKRRSRRDVFKDVDFGDKQWSVKKTRSGRIYGIRDNHRK